MPSATLTPSLSLEREREKTAAISDSGHQPPFEPDEIIRPRDLGPPHTDRALQVVAARRVGVAENEAAARAPLGRPAHPGLQAPGRGSWFAVMAALRGRPHPSWFRKNRAHSPPVYTHGYTDACSTWVASGTALVWTGTLTALSERARWRRSLATSRAARHAPSMLASSSRLRAPPPDCRPRGFRSPDWSGFWPGGRAPRPRGRAGPVARATIPGGFRYGSRCGAIPAWPLPGRRPGLLVLAVTLGPFEQVHRPLWLAPWSFRTPPPPIPTPAS